MKKKRRRLRSNPAVRADTAFPSADRERLPTLQRLPKDTHAPCLLAPNPPYSGTSLI